MAITTYYPADDERLVALGPRLHEFEVWLALLDCDHGVRDWPYGQGPLAMVTGLDQWIDFFNEGFSPTEALDEDLSDNYG